MSAVRAQAGVPVLAQFTGFDAPTMCAPLVVDSTTGFIYSWKTGDVIVLSGAGGTVTSIAQSFTGGLISVAGSPVTTTGTLALTVAGTSGGIPYFSGATTWASSTAPAAGLVMLWGGAGNPPTGLTAGASTTVLHGNSTYSAVSLTADVSGILPTANGGTGIAYFTAAGPSTARVYTFPDQAATILYSGGALGTPSSGTATNLSGTAASLTAGIATNVAGGAAGSLPYQTASATTALLALGAANAHLFVNSGATAPAWGSPVKVITSTIDTGNASASVGYTGVGFKPSSVIALALVNTSSEVSIGFADASTQRVIFNANIITAGTWAYDTQLVYMDQAVATNYGGSLTSFDSDGFTISWTKTGLTSGTALLFFLCYR